MKKPIRRRARAVGSALANQVIERADVPEIREWGVDAIQEDRLACAGLLFAAGHREAAELLESLPADFVRSGAMQARSGGRVAKTA